MEMNLKEDIMKQLLSVYSELKPINVDEPQNIIEGRFANLYQMYAQDEMRPVIAGEFTHWEPMRMLRVDEFARAID